MIIFSLDMWLYKIYHPAVFQGDLNRRSYFEGWYLKHVDRRREEVYAFIPGIALGGDSHAFIQLINGITGETEYETFPLDQFSWDKRRFAIRLGQSTFSAGGCRLDFTTKQHHIRGTLHYRQRVAYPASLLNPGIMGWFSFIPTMECKHAVVSLTHELEGTLEVDGRRVDFDGGRGYIEKDWGRSFPSAYFWVQCNHFSGPRTSLMLSIARIPWRGHFFIGFLGFFYLDGQYYGFATYNRARVTRFECPDPRTVLVTVQRKKLCLELTVHLKRSGNLKAPRAGEMERVIKESLSSQVDLLLRRGSRVIFTGTGQAAGCELQGELESYFQG